MKGLPLEGYRVVDMTEVWAGPFGTSQLGDLGADVIRVESYPRVAQSRPAQARLTPQAGQAAPPRSLPPNVGAGGAAPLDAPRPWDRASAYHMTNRNKLGICMNVLDPRGRELFYQLISVSDAFVIGYSAGTAARMSIDYETLVRYKPDLVMLSFAAWGEKGPYQGYSTIGSGPDAWSGHHELRRYPDLDPSSVPGGLHVDAIASMTIPYAVMAGLHSRERTGRGQFIDLSLAEVLMNHIPQPFLSWSMNSDLAQPIGNVDPDIAPTGCYPCRDEDTWAVIVVRTDEQWRSLRIGMGDPAWADRPDYDTVAGRVRNRHEIDEHLTRWTRTMTPDEVFAKLQAVQVPAGPVNHVDGTLGDRHLNERGFYRWVTHPITGQYRRPAPPYTLTRTPSQFWRHTNLLGEHNHDVLCGLLGVSDEEYEDLIARGVVGNSYRPEFAVDA